MFAPMALKIDIGVSRGEWSDLVDIQFGKESAMLGRYRCGGIRRRDFLGAAAGLPLVETLTARAQEPKAGAGATPTPAGKGELGVPGLYPGRVVEVRHAGLVRDGSRNREAMRATLNRGLTNLTGAEHPVEAWRTFVSPGEAVGIKVVPNGHPGAHTSPELVLEVIAGLESAGIKRKDMVVFDRYLREFLTAGYDKILPDGVAWGGLTPEGWDPGQMRIKFDGNDPIAGYDPDQFVQLTLVTRGQDPKDDRTFRSHLGQIVTRRLDKIICLPCLKDHHAAGATGALKNMSHGLVNNVFRSHSSPDGIAMCAFIPSVVSNPIIRRKCVLHIMDASRGVWEGGPFGKNPEWLWDYNALLLATDPVAMDHIEWDILDAKRKQMGVPGVGAVGRLAADPFKHEGYDIRQPQYIAIAGQVGLGNFEKKSPKGRRFSIDHQVSSAV
jgi:Domain of unknown function (DUF362)